MTGSGAICEVNIGHNQSAIAKMEAIFSKILHSLDLMQPHLCAAHEGGAQFPEFTEDVKNILSASEFFHQLVEQGRETLTSKIESNSLQEDDLKEIRHDLRAKVGAMIGYSELIQEELSDFGTDEAGEYSKILGNVLDMAKHLIPLIDGLRLDEVLLGEEFDANEGSNESNLLFETNLSYGDQFADCTVLIIDDSAYNREILSRRLSRYGVKVATAGNGADGLELVKNKPIDLILLDIMMPIMNGYEVLTRLKADSALKDIPVLMISALSEVDSIVRCIEIGAEDYLPSPFNPVVLHARIKACLEKKKLRDREQENQLQLDLERQKLEMAIESIEDGFAVFDAQSRLSLCNKQFRSLYPGVEALGGVGFTYEELLRKNRDLGVYFEERRHSEHQESADDPEDWIRMNVTRQKHESDYLICLRDGRWIEVINSSTPDGGKVSVHKDVTARKQDEERLTFLALHDALTGLANRSFFETHLNDAFVSGSEGLKPFAVMFLDLDGFKKINDTLGHDVGDQVLIFVAEALKKTMRSHDVIARLGGDEFALIIPTPITRTDLDHLTDRILKAIGDHYEYEGTRVPFGVSIGVARYPGDGDTPEVLLSHSDEAMYAAKKSGKGHARFYEDLKDVKGA